MSDAEGETPRHRSEDNEKHESLGIVDREIERVDDGACSGEEGIGQYSIERAGLDCVPGRVLDNGNEEQNERSESDGESDGLPV